jgi:hypothetical protein
MIEPTGLEVIGMVILILILLLGFFASFVWILDLIINRKSKPKRNTFFVGFKVMKEDRITYGYRQIFTTLDLTTEEGLDSVVQFIADENNGGDKTNLIIYSINKL